MTDMCLCFCSKLINGLNLKAMFQQRLLSFFPKRSKVIFPRVNLYQCIHGWEQLSIDQRIVVRKQLESLAISSRRKDGRSRLNHMTQFMSDHCS